MSTTEINDLIEELHKLEDWLVFAHQLERSAIASKAIECIKMLKDTEETPEELRARFELAAAREFGEVIAPHFFRKFSGGKEYYYYSEAHFAWLGYQLGVKSKEGVENERA